MANVYSNIKVRNYLKEEVLIIMLKYTLLCLNYFGYSQQNKITNYKKGFDVNQQLRVIGFIIRNLKSQLLANRLLIAR